MQNDRLDVKLVRNKLGWHVSFEQRKDLSYYLYSILIKLMREYMRCEIRVAKICRSINRHLK